MSRIVVRVDGNTQMGVGHVMRCMTLAGELKARGHVMCFACRSLPAGYPARIVEAGFELVELTGEIRSEDTAGDLPHSHWLGVSQAQDAAETSQLAGESDAVIVDHYALDTRWEREVGSGKVLLAIDDLSDRAHAVQMLLNQNLVPRDMYASLVDPSALICLGPQFALLRPGFALAREQAAIRSNLRQVLVFMGGADAVNATAIVLDALLDQALADSVETVNVVVGSGHPDLAGIRTGCGERGYHLFVDTQDMARLMVEADLAIGAAGSAAWERAAVGLPSIMLSVAENQRQIAQSVAESGAGLFAGDLAEPGAAAVADLAAGVSARVAESMQPGVLERMSKCAFDLTDGLGCSRVADRFEAML